MSEANDIIEDGRSFLSALFNHLNYSIDIEHRDGDDAIVYELNGGVEPLETRPDLVSAITLLAAQAMSRTADKRINCLLDVGGQFEKRRALLETTADDIQRAVIQTGRKAVLEGLSSAERRVVHVRLRDSEDVETQSEGDDRNRLLLVERA